MQNKHEGSLGDVGPLQMSGEKKGAIDNSSRNTTTMEMTGKEDENRAVDLCPSYSIDGPIEEN